jgi:hypothetical protein
MRANSYGEQDGRDHVVEIHIQPSLKTWCNPGSAGLLWALLGLIFRIPKREPVLPTRSNLHAIQPGHRGAVAIHASRRPGC